MEIYLAAEHVYHLIPQVNPEIARDRVEQKKVNLVAGTMGALFSQPKPDDIRLAAFENRLEPFWLVSAASRTVYDRNRTYTIAASGPEVQAVTLLGQELPAAPQAKGAPLLTLPAVEHCLQELHTRQTFDGLTGAKVDLLKYASAAKTEIADLNTFAPPDVLVVPPQARATAVVRQVTAEVVQPVQNVQAIHEERVDIDAIELHFRPVYAFEYEWTSKNKRVVVEFDPVTAEIHGNGRRLQDQIKNIVSRDLLFDITADAAGLLVPGGSIAVKLVKAVVDRR
ncbi:MAG TPA: hypothetical protein PLT26_09340 [Anaerolineaceae bacterium]|nr:hypothetical protein [Anaerolineaceae bacterium]HQH86893.1 hypothetical protein [Anaerolineaceae bacterium]